MALGSACYSRSLYGCVLLLTLFFDLWHIYVLSVKLQIDFLVNNAGILQMGLSMDCDFDVVFPVLNTNVLGTISLTKAVLPHMVRNRNGQIVVISSASGKSGKFDISWQGGRGINKHHAENSALKHEHNEGFTFLHYHWHWEMLFLVNQDHLWCNLTTERYKNIKFFFQESIIWARQKCVICTPLGTI